MFLSRFFQCLRTRPLPGRTLSKVISGPMLCAAMLLTPMTGVASVKAEYATPNWRFGITSPYNPSGYDIASLRVGAYLDWQADSHPALPNGVEYIRVLRVSNQLFDSVLASLDTLIPANLGTTWIVGNEPDRYYYQDSVTPEVYADRYYAIATKIRGLDPSARLGFGAVVQPTPIRLRYLNRALGELYLKAGSQQNACALIDIWTIHNFILNEDKNGWGAGIPVGFENDYADAVKVTNFADTYSNAIFLQRVQNFRSWMNAHGERAKPLWITEYGSLLPPINKPGGNNATVSDQNTAHFMQGTFNDMLHTRSSLTGMPADDNHLVQRWFWYSLNEHRYTFGGSLFDPDNGKAITYVGKAFRDYPRFTLNLPIVLMRKLK